MTRRFRCTATVILRGATGRSQTVAVLMLKRAGMAALRFPMYIGMAPEMPRARLSSSSEMELDIDEFEIVDVVTQ